jgi:hypothetical protein
MAYSKKDSNIEMKLFDGLEYIITSCVDKTDPPSAICSTFKGCQFLTRLDKLVEFHLQWEKNYNNWYLPVWRKESAHELDSLLAIIDILLLHAHRKANDSKHRHFDAAE